MAREEQQLGHLVAFGLLPQGCREVTQGPLLWSPQLENLLAEGGPGSPAPLKGPREPAVKVVTPVIIPIVPAPLPAACPIQPPEVGLGEGKQPLQVLA